MFETAKELSDYLTARLVEWADFFIRDFSGIGYPNKNVLHVLREMGGNTSKGTGPKYPPTNLAALEIEDWVKDMAIYHADRAAALRIKYFHSNVSTKDQLRKYNRWLDEQYARPSLNDQGHEMKACYHVGETQFNRKVLYARQALETRIEIRAKENFKQAA